MKPYDGGAWRGVSRIADESALLAAYEQSGKYLMHLQAGVDDYDLFVRCIGLGPQFHIISYDPTQPLHDRYEMRRDFLSPAETQELRDMTLTINTFFGWDFNSCEAIRKDGKWYLIDFANACPDSQVTSLHYHFPWLVIANVKWSLYVAATKKKFRKTLDWEPYYQVMQQTDSFVDRLAGYARIGTSVWRPRLFTNSARLFGARGRGCLGVFWQRIGTASGSTESRGFFPSHEVEQFTELFWQRIQAWREHTIRTACGRPLMIAWLQDCPDRQFAVGGQQHSGGISVGARIVGRGMDVGGTPRRFLCDLHGRDDFE
jgi:hypothetical protein